MALGAALKERGTPLSFLPGENSPVRVAFSVNSARVEHYSDVIEAMSRHAAARFVEKFRRAPSPQSVEFYKKELVRLMVIQRDQKRAQLLEINESNILLG